MHAKVTFFFRGTGLLLLALSLVLVPLAAASVVDNDNVHVVGDNVADTPVEIDNLQAQQNGGVGGHLPGSSANVELVGQLTLSNVEEGQISDVATLGNYAYLGSFDTPNCDKGGVYIVDISDPTAPTEVGFIAAPAGSFVGEGVQAIRLKTKTFKGDVLVLNNEICAITGNQVGGISLYDVTNPLAPLPLAIGVGDTNPGGGVSTANQTHSAFMWPQGKKAYVVIVDDEELGDVDIFDISTPSAPVQIAEVGLADWPGAQNSQSDGIGNFQASMIHDVVVKKIKGHQLMLVSYWDAGYIVLDVDNPAAPVFVNDTDFTDPDPLTGFSPPEGNAHQAEWSRDNKFILAADEDFSPFRLIAEITSGPFAGGTFAATQGSDVVQIDADTPLAGPTYFVELACNASLPPPAPSADAIAIVERGVCSFSEKAANVEAAGYAGGIVFNQDAPGRCDALVSMFAVGNIPFLFVGRSTAFQILGITGYDPNNCPGGPNPALPAAGAAGSTVNVTSQFDGWGYVRLFNANTLQEIDTYAIPESLDPAFAADFGDLSVHEVATDPEKNLAYISYYAGGLRVVEFGNNGIQEVGHYIDPGGNNFWGVQIFEPKDGPFEDETLVLASDRDSGLWIFRYTGEGDDDGDGDD